MANLKVYTLPEFAELKLPPKRYIIDPFLPERGLIEIYSKTGVGKTTFAMSLAMAAALGKPFLKWGVPKRWRVLYVDGEMSGWASVLIKKGLPAGSPSSGRNVATSSIATTYIDGCCGRFVNQMC